MILFIKGRVLILKKKTYLKLFITLILLTVSIVYIYYDDTNKKEKH